jgi:hypothetical protein
MDKISSFLGAVVDGETRVFGTKNPATPQVENNRHAMTGHSFRMVVSSRSSKGYVFPKSVKIKQRDGRRDLQKNRVKESVSPSCETKRRQIREGDNS